MLSVVPALLTMWATFNFGMWNLTSRINFLENLKFPTLEGETETHVYWSLCAIWRCHGAKDGEELHAENVDHILYSIYSECQYLFNWQKIGCSHGQKLKIIALINCHTAFRWCYNQHNYKTAINKCRKRTAHVHWHGKQAYTGFGYGSLQHNQSVNDRNWKKSLFKRDFENQHYGGPTFTDPLHCWALFISPASGHLSFISHHDPVSRQSRCAQASEASNPEARFYEVNTWITTYTRISIPCCKTKTNKGPWSRSVLMHT